jgi:hypothetical protein
MNDIQEEVIAPAKPTKKKVIKRKAKRAAPRLAAEALAPADGIYTGLTVTNCCDACNVDGCVISGKSYCAHPRKGGLNSRDQQDITALRRAQQSQRILGKQLLDAKMG